MPGLFNNEELEKALTPLRDQHDQSGFGHANLFEFFVSRVRANLHVVLAMSPENEEYWKRCQSNPALLTQCYVQWFEAWSVEGMQQIPAEILKVIEDLTLY